jgi:AcrR family transcriptional regulator
MASEQPNGDAQKSDSSATSAERLLDTAATLFRQKGYAGTTTRELAAALGLRNASLYHYTRSKADLLYEICITSLTMVQSAVTEATQKESDPLARVVAMITRHMQVILANSDAHTTMLIEMRALPEDQHREIIFRRGKYESIIRNVLTEAQQAGVLRGDVSPAYLTLALFSLMNWSLFWYDSAGELSIEDLAEILIRLFLEGAQNEARREEAAVSGRAAPLTGQVKG